MRYLYSLIRFVPDPATGEFVNIGAIAGNDDVKDWAVRRVGNLARARRLDDGRGLVNHALMAVERLEEMADAATGELKLGDVPAISESLLPELHAEWRNVVQMSEPLPIVAQSAEEALELVFDDMVIDPERRKRRSIGLPQLAKVVRRAFTEAGLRERLEEKPLVEAAGYEHRFEFAVANGRVVQLIRTWSLETADREEIAKDVQAWAWMAGKIRRGGGRAIADGHEVGVPDDVRMVAIYALTDSVAGCSVLEEARHAASEIKGELVEYREVSRLAAEAKEIIDG